MSPSHEHLRDAVRMRFAAVARAPEQEGRFPVGFASAVQLGYDPDELAALPASATASFCGVGSPLGLAELLPGQSVLDLGCGAGLDCLLAARRVGPSGRVIGVDLCPEMLDRARLNADLLRQSNLTFLATDIEHTNLPDASVDVVLSNGVFNLCPDKPALLAEVFRVLRPGGRLQMADILLHEDVDADQVARLGAWSD